MMNMYIKAFIVAVVVGSILLVINQFDALFGQGDFRLIPALLTYCVPFIVFLLGNCSNAKRSNTNSSNTNRNNQKIEDV